MKTALVLILCISALFLNGCMKREDRGKTVPNYEKPLVWYNNQPANSLTGELDMDALAFNEKSWYVGNNARQGGELQGQMVIDYVRAHGAALDRNGDGIIGYVLLIGDIGHNDAITRTCGSRMAMGTAVADAEHGATEINGLEDVCHLPVGVNLDGSSKYVQDGSVTLDGQPFIVREIASREMKSISGAMWDATTAVNTVNAWDATFGDRIDVVISNNDVMGMAVFNAWARRQRVPVFGYDADPDCVAAIAEGFAGTVSQNVDVQAYMILHLVRNGLDNADPMTGIAIPDEAGNVLTPEMYAYRSDERSFYANNSAVTLENYKDYLDPLRPNPQFNGRMDRGDTPADRIWLNFANGSSFFFAGQFASQFNNNAANMNMTLKITQGDSVTESSVVDRLVNPQEYDGFVLVLIKKDNAAAYLSRLRW